MFVIKIIGSLIVFFSCSAAGIYLSSKDKFRAEELKEMKRGLMLLKSEISFSQKPLYEAMIEISEKLSDAVAEIFEDTGRLLKYKKVANVSEAWGKTIRNRKSRTYFKAEDIDVFISFGAALGGMDKVCQIENIDVVNTYIDSKVKILMNKNSKDSRLFRSAGVLFGILIVVVLF